MIKGINTIHIRVTFIFLVFLCISGSFSWAAEEYPLEHDDTLIMFVGEELEILSIASRREESAWQAPAIADVVTRRDIEERGIQTVSEALSMVPGFYMAQREWGTKSYLRGIPDSALLLYDTVPMGSDVTKSLQPLEQEISLASVKRIEIIRGPGSVLWGPDAFAGIVNIVPMSGKDLEGSESGIRYGSNGNSKSVYCNVGHNAGFWDGFLSVSGQSAEEDDTTCNVVRYWGDGTPPPVDPLYRYGAEKPGESDYFEASGRLSFRNVFTLSARFSDYRKPYALTAPEGNYSWRENRSVPSGFIKAEAKADINRFSALRFTGSFSWLSPEYEIIDLTLKQKERVLYGETIYDRTLFAGRGLFTAGLSHREKYISNAPIWDSYLPDYLGPNNTRHLPLISNKNYHTTLSSVFCQYTHKLNGIDFWIGLRGDDHNEYRDHLSYNLGVVWSPDSQWIIKALYGTAYRTPFARQLLEEETPDLEKAETASVQVSWKASRSAGMSICGFLNRIENHIMEDPYAGLSLPNSQNIEGVEVQGYCSPLRGVNLSANLTIVDNNGPDETYHYNDYSFWDGEKWVKHYTDLKYPYDRGPHTIFNLMGTWKPVEKWTFFARLGYFSSQRLIYPRNEEIRSVPDVWLLDTAVTVRDIGYPGLDLQLSVKNLTDTHYETPGTYRTIEGNPLSLELMLKMSW